MLAIAFWHFPIVSASIWLAMLLGMFASWIIIGRPRYTTMVDGQIYPFISNIGADVQPLFVVGSFISMLFLNLSVIQKQWPHRDARSPAWEKVPIHTVCAYSSILLSIAGSIGLILLSCFDYVHYTSVHYSSLALFIAAHSVCAILLVVQSTLACVTSKWQDRLLFTIFIIRASLAIIEATFGIVFGFSSQHPGLDGDFSAILEWGK
ncbi:hypothetical protein RU639_001562 [Aspergillus parasiticus]